MVGEFGLPYSSDEYGDVLLKLDMSMLISRVAQLLASIPDKARLEALPALSSQYPPWFLLEKYISKILGNLFWF